ncbi:MULTISPECIES: hypothetical protein [unclassified Rhizobium]
MPEISFKDLPLYSYDYERPVMSLGSRSVQERRHEVDNQEVYGY